MSKPPRCANAYIVTSEFPHHVTFWLDPEVFVTKLLCVLDFFHHVAFEQEGAEIRVGIKDSVITDIFCTEFYAIMNIRVFLFFNKVFK